MIKAGLRVTISLLIIQSCIGSLCNVFNLVDSELQVGRETLRRTIESKGPRSSGELTLFFWVKPNDVGDKTPRELFVLGPPPADPRKPSESNDPGHPPCLVDPIELKTDPILAEDPLIRENPNCKEKVIAGFIEEAATGSIRILMEGRKIIARIEGGGEAKELAIEGEKEEGWMFFALGVDWTRGKAMGYMMKPAGKGEHKAVMVKGAAELRTDAAVTLMPEGAGRDFASLAGLNILFFWISELSRLQYFVYEEASTREGGILTSLVFGRGGRLRSTGRVVADYGEPDQTSIETKGLRVSENKPFELGALLRSTASAALPPRSFTVVAGLEVGGEEWIKDTRAGFLKVSDPTGRGFWLEVVALETGGWAVAVVFSDNSELRSTRIAEIGKEATVGVSVMTLEGGAETEVWFWTPGRVEAHKRPPLDFDLHRLATSISTAPNTIGQLYVASLALLESPLALALAGDQNQRLRHCGGACGLALMPATRPSCLWCARGVLLAAGGGCAPFCPPSARAVQKRCSACPTNTKNSLRICSTRPRLKVLRVAEAEFKLRLDPAPPVSAAVNRLFAVTVDEGTNSFVVRSKGTKGEFGLEVDFTGSVYGKRLRVRSAPSSVTLLSDIEGNYLETAETEYPVFALRGAEGQRQLATGLGALSFLLPLLFLGIAVIRRGEVGTRLLAGVQRLQLTSAFCHLAAILPPDLHAYLRLTFDAGLGGLGSLVLFPSEQYPPHPNFFDEEIISPFSVFVAFTAVIAALIASFSSSNRESLRSTISALINAVGVPIAFIAGRAATNNNVFGWAALAGLAGLAACFVHKKEARGLVASAGGAALAGAAGQRPLAQLTAAAVWCVAFAGGESGSRGGLFSEVLASAGVAGSAVLIWSLGIFDAVEYYSSFPRDFIGWVIILLLIFSNWIPAIQLIFSSSPQTPPRPITIESPPRVLEVEENQSRSYSQLGSVASVGMMDRKKDIQESEVELQSGKLSLHDSYIESDQVEPHRD